MTRNEPTRFTKDVEESSTEDDSNESGEVLSDARDLVTHVISVEDDPSLSPWTLRVAIIGLGLSVLEVFCRDLLFQAPDGWCVNYVPCDYFVRRGNGYGDIHSAPGNFPLPQSISFQQEGKMS